MHSKFNEKNWNNLMKLKKGVSQNIKIFFHKTMILSNYLSLFAFKKTNIYVIWWIQLMGQMATIMCIQRK